MNNLPVQLTPFIGRQAEIVELCGLLADPACRLLTLVGIGGSGKTRLAIEATHKLRDQFDDGICFVELQPVSSTDYLITTIGDALGILFRGQDEPRKQLLHYLREKSLLIVLDNFEHLLAGAELLSAMLATAPRVKVLVTSREVLSLQEEWLYPVSGMHFPTGNAQENLQQYEAVQLFVDQARRVQRSFSVEADLFHIVRICQYAEGIPLGIELAASWLKVLPSAEIATEMRRNLDFLYTTWRNVPDRHRSMRAVFDQTWKLLTDDERHLFQRLSVFRGSFQREAAEQIAGASLQLLSALADKSLLRQDVSGRYQMHELLRQYAQEKLEQSPEEALAIRRTFLNYWAAFMKTRETDITGVRQHDVLNEVSAELENIRVAWSQAIAYQDLDFIQNASQPIYAYYDLQGRYQEGINASERAIVRLEEIERNDERDCALALLLVQAGWHYIRIGRFDAARTAFTRSRSLFEALGMTPPSGFGTNPLNGLALLSVVLGDYAAAIQIGEQARQENEAQGDTHNLQITFYVLANAAFYQGDYDPAREYARRAYELTDKTANQWMKAYVLIVLGDIASSLNDYDRAWGHYQASYDIKRELNDPGGMASALKALATVAWLKVDYAQASKLFQQSEQLYRDASDPGGVGMALCGLGDVAQVQDEVALACDTFHQALQIAIEIQWPQLMVGILASVADLLLRLGELETATELLSLVVQHPAAPQFIRTRAQQSLIQAQAHLSTKTFDTATQRGAAGDLSHIAEATRDQLPNWKRVYAIPSAHNPRKVEQSLIDSLSERELEILRLLADGLTNDEIASRLTIVLGTVKAHNHNIFSKLGVNNRVQAITRAKQLNLI